MKCIFTAVTLLLATTISNVINIENVNLSQKELCVIKHNNIALVDETEDEYYSPAYGDEDVEEYYDTEDDESWSDRDQYENNNTLKSATKIGVNSSISGTIHKSFWKYLFTRTVDEDYYYFNVFGDGVLSVNLTVPSSVDYNIELIKYDDELSARYRDADTLTNSSNEGNGTAESITWNVTPGTYYIRVFADTSSDYSSSSYTLSTSLSYNFVGSTSIPKYRFNKGAKGAIWKSDLTPFGTLVHKIDESLDLGCTNPAPIYDELNTLTNNEGIVDSVVYLWSGEWRLTIAEFVYDCKEELEANYERNQRIQMNFQYVTDGVSLVGNVLQLVVKVPAVVVVGEILCAASDFASAIVPLLFPEVWDTTIGELIDYLTALYN